MSVDTLTSTLCLLASGKFKVIAKKVIYRAHSMSFGTAIVNPPQSLFTAVISGKRVRVWFEASAIVCV